MLASLRELLQYRSLLRDLVARDLKVRYKRSALGILWTMLNPLLLMVIFTIVFAHVLRVQIEHFTVYFLSFVLALVPSGAYAERKGPKNLMLLGVLLTGVSLLAMTFVTNIYAMFAVRALAEAGVPVLLYTVNDPARARELRAAGAAAIITDMPDLLLAAQ